MITVIIGQKKRPKGAEDLRWEVISPEEVVALATTTALFGGTRTFVLVGALDGVRKDEFIDRAKELAHSPHTFIFEEEKLLKKETDTLTSAGAKIERVEREQKKEYRFDRFGVAVALGQRDKKQLWLSLMAALRAGEKPEALAGLLAWKARAMKDRDLSRQIVFMYHDSHRGAGDLELLLERFALKL